MVCQWIDCSHMQCWINAACKTALELDCNIAYHWWAQSRILVGSVQDPGMLANSCMLGMSLALLPVACLVGLPCV